MKNLLLIYLILFSCTISLTANPVKELNPTILANPKLSNATTITNKVPQITNNTSKDTSISKLDTKNNQKNIIKTHKKPQVVVKTNSINKKVNNKNNNSVKPTIQPKKDNIKNNKVVTVNNKTKLVVAPKKATKTIANTNFTQPNNNNKNIEKNPLLKNKKGINPPIKLSQVKPKKTTSQNINKTIANSKLTAGKKAIKPTPKKNPPKRPIAKKVPPKVKPFYTPNQQKLLDEFQKRIPKKIAIIDGKEITQKEFFEFFISNLPGRRPPANLTIDSAPYIFALYAENMVNTIILEKHLTSKKIVPNENETLQYYQKLLSKLSPAEKQVFEARLTAMRQTQDNWLKRLAKDKDIQREICHFNFFQKEIASKITIPESEIRNYYNQNSRRFQHPEYAHISAIRVSFHPRKKGNKDIAKKKIDAIHNQLVKNPKLFEKLARLESDCPSKANGGKLGIVHRHMLHKKIDKVLFTMANNTISQPIEVNNAFYIIKCESRYGVRTLSYNEVKNEITELLQQEKMHLKVNEFFQTLRKKYKIQTFIKMPPHRDIKMEIPKDAKLQ